MMNVGLKRKRKEQEEKLEELCDSFDYSSNNDRTRSVEI